MIQDALLADVRGFMKSRVILTAAELDIFTLLDGSILSAPEISGRLSTDPRVTTRVLDCLVSFDLLKKEKGRYSNTEKGLLLSSRHPETVLPMVQHMNHLWENWGELTEVARSGTEREIKSGLKFSEGQWKAFIGAMHVAARGLAGEIADFYNAGRFSRLIDIGGASGTYTIAFLRKHPHMNAVIFDLPEVISLARDRIAEEGLQDRVEFVAGDFYEESLPEGCDLALLSAIIHQNSPQENLGLFRSIFGSLTRGGALLIRDHIMDDSRTNPPAGVLFAINMLVNTRGGDTYTFSEIEAALKEAGFEQVDLIRSGGKMDCLIEAVKP